MRKEVISHAGLDLAQQSSGTWLDLDQIARVQVTSEDPRHPIDFALTSPDGRGWRAGGGGRQTIRLIFDRPQRLTRIRLRFEETESDRTQEFALHWSPDHQSPGREIVRQRWNFSPTGSTIEIEDYTVDLAGAVWLGLTIDPDVSLAEAVATLAEWRVA
jgi:hypothetical protein